MSCTAIQMSKNIRIYAEGCQANACLNQDKVNETIQALQQEQAFASVLKQQAELFINMINECEITTEFDPDDEINEELLNIEKVLRNIHTGYQSGLHAARNDHDINGTDEHAIVTEYERAIKAVKGHYEVNEQLRLLIMECDADLSPVSKEFDNAEDLIAELNS